MINFAIIGTGVIAKYHALAIGMNPNAQVVAVCDMNEARAKEFAAEHNAPKVFSDYHELLKDPDIHAVSICTPSGTHGEISIAAAKAGKHILCEKPIETKKEKIDELIREVEAHNVKMDCVYQRRFQEIPAKVKAALDSGVFGKVLMASVYMKYWRSPDYYKSAGWRATWEFDGGGCLMNQGVHGVDLICWFMGGVKKVNAITRTQLHNIEVEDAAVAAVEFNNGAIGVIEGSTCVNPANNCRFEIHCENGTISFDDGGVLQWVLNGEDLAVSGTSGDLGAKEDPTKLNECGHSPMVEDLVNSILNDTEPSIGPKEARKAVDTILAIYQSSREGKEVVL